MVLAGHRDGRRQTQDDLVRLGIVGGARTGELFTTRVGDFDLGAGTVRVGQDRGKAEATKTGSRTVYLDHAAVEVLRYYVEGRDPAERFMGDRARTTMSHAHAYVRTACREIGVPEHPLYGLRRSATDAYYEAGATAEEEGATDPPGLPRGRRPGSVNHRRGWSYGSITASMTWMTPLAEGMSVTETGAPAMVTTPSSIITSALEPSSVVMDSIESTSAAVSFSPATWNSRIEVSAGMSFNSASTVPSGSAAMAASVGAKTVNGPPLCSVAVSPAGSTSASSVPKSPAMSAVSMRL